jgi:hypothetical protein
LLIVLELGDHPTRVGGKRFEEKPAGKVFDRLSCHLLLSIVNYLEHQDLPRER